MLTRIAVNPSVTNVLSGATNTLLDNILSETGNNVMG